MKKKTGMFDSSKIFIIRLVACGNFVLPSIILLAFGCFRSTHSAPVGNYLFFTSQPGSGTARKKFNASFVKQRFFSPVMCLCFGVWGSPESGDRIGGVILVLRTFPELVGRSVQNLVEIGIAV